MKNESQAKTIHLVGWESAGPWVVLAKAVRRRGDAHGRRHERLPLRRREIAGRPDDAAGGVEIRRYGGIRGIVPPGELLMHNHRHTSTGKLVPDAYRAAGADAKLKREPLKLSGEKVVEWVLRPGNK